MKHWVHSDQKKELLTKNIEFFGKLIEVMSKMRDEGWSESYALTQLPGIKKNTFRHLMINSAQGFPAQGMSFDMENAHVVVGWSWQEEIFHAVFTKETYAPSDVDKTINEMLASNFLDDRTKDMLLARYRDGATLEEVGKQYGITRERVRQLIFKALIRIRRSEWGKRLRMGLQGETQASENAIVEKNKYKELIQANSGDVKALKALRDEINRRIYQLTSKSEEEEEIETPIASLHLSVRSMNGLMRAGIKTIEKLIEMPPASLRTLHGLGIKSVDEITEAIEQWKKAPLLDMH